MSQLAIVLGLELEPMCQTTPLLEDLEGVGRGSQQEPWA